MENYLIQITNYLLTQSWQIAALVAVIAAVNLALKNRSAHVRYLLWLIVLAKCLVPPLFTMPLAVLPQERYAEPVPVLPAQMPTAFEAMDMPAAETPVSPAFPVTATLAPTAAERPARLTTRQWLVFGWIAGVAVFLLFAVTKALRTNSWLRRQRRLLPVELRSGIENLFSGVGIKTLPKVWLVEGIGQPFVWGLLRGSIYLPADFVKVNSAEHRRSVLGHELSHILRFDAVVNLIEVFAQAIFWFHPFVWWANKRIRAEREKCCDEMAIARLGAKAKDYSSAIVDTLIVEHESTRPVPSLAVAGPVRNIEERIKTIMKPGKKFYRRPSLVAATVVLLLALLTVPTALVLTARAETKAAPEREEGLGRDTFVQPTERDVDEASEEGERGRREVEEQERHRPEVWALEISQHRRELQERERRIEHEIEGLRDDQDEEARELHAELRQIREKLRDIERELRGPERERREAEMPVPELLQGRRELQEKGRHIERELEGLRDDQDEEAQELQAELRKIHEQIRRIERQLHGPERERRGSVERERPEAGAHRRELIQQRRELAERARHIERELEELGDREEAQELRGELHEIEQRTLEIDRQLRGPERGQRERAQLQERRQPRRPEARGDLERQVQQLRGEVKELRQEIGELRRLLERLLGREHEERIRIRGTRRSPGARERIRDVRKPWEREEAREPEEARERD